MEYHRDHFAAALSAARIAGRRLADALQQGADDPAPGTQRELLSALKDKYPEYGWRTGGSAYEPGRDRDGHVWLLRCGSESPIAGAGCRGACVAVALLRRGEPVLGVVYSIGWPDDEGELFAWTQGLARVQRNGRPVSPRREKPPTIAVSPEADSKPRFHAELAQPRRYLTVPGAPLRLAHVAAGDVEASPLVGAFNECDLAAGQALLRGAGLELYDSGGHPVRYSERGDLLTCGKIFFAGAESTVRQMAPRGWEHLLERRCEPVELYDLRKPDWRRQIRNTNTVRRAHGCLLGLLAGDALGSMVGFLTPEAVAARYPDGVRRMEDGGTHATIAGQPTDDSEMALILSRSILQLGRYDAEEAARAYCWWYRSSPFDIGNTVARALRAGARLAGKRVEGIAEACRHAANPDSEANGALMRAAPLGILAAGGKTRVEEAAGLWADLDAALTHPNPVCRDANRIFVASLAYAICGGGDGASVYRHARELARAWRADRSVRLALRRAGKSRPRDYVSQQGHVLIALQNAFFQALHAPSLEEGIVDTVQQGGDTDTNAAIAGALLGAIHGRTSIPRQWLDRILTCRPIAEVPGVHRPRPRAFWPVDALVLAEELVWLGGQIG